MPKQNMHYTCISCITIDYVVNFDKKNHPQVYLEECKYRVKKCKCQDLNTKNTRFISTEIKSDSESSDLELDSEKIETKFDVELMAKLEKSDSD